MEFALPTDTREASGLSLVRRVWVARFDVEEEARGLAEKYVGVSLFLPITLYENKNHSLFSSGCGSLWAWSWSRSCVPC